MNNNKIENEVHMPMLSQIIPKAKTCNTCMIKSG